MKRGLDHIVDQQIYDEYLRRLDVRAVLDHYGVENDHEEPGKEDSTEIIHSCLLDRVERHHSNGDANPSAAANVERKKYICYSFWGGDFFEFIMKMEDKESFNQILPLVQQFLSGSTLERDDFNAELDRIFATSAARRAPQVGLRGYSPRILKPWAFTHPYLLERGIDHDTASRLHIGWREDLNRITIPVFWRDELVGWQARAVPDRPGQWPGTWGDPYPKYKSSPGFPKSAILYVGDGRGHLDRGPTAVVVESPFSVIKAVSLGLGVPVLGTFGAKVSQRQIDLLRGFDRVVVWADDDDAGRIMERKLVNGLHRFTNVSVVNPDVGMDLGDYDTAESVMEKIDAAIPAVLKMAEWEKR